jgi:hypothetical protein
MSYIVVKDTIDDTFTLYSGFYSADDMYLSPHEIIIAEGEDKKELLDAYPQAEDLT